jgi:hypothetical protein
MPKFKFSITRTYTITEGFEREYEADSLEEAQALADAMAQECNMDCPDDCSEQEGGFTESSDFEADLLRDAECSAGFHSWLHVNGKLPANYTCTRCGEPYGNPE